MSKKSAAEIARLTGRKAIGLACDVRDEQQVESTVDAVLKAFGISSDFTKAPAFIGGEFLNVIWPLIISVMRSPRTRPNSDWSHHRRAGAHPNVTRC